MRAGTCRAPRTGGGIASSRTGSNSGATGRTACTSAACSCPARTEAGPKACFTRERDLAVSDERAKLTTRAALASVSVACFLLLLKGYAAWTTGSVAMLGSLADTGLDVIASLVTLFGVRIAAMPADRDHRFGHGKAE